MLKCSLYEIVFRVDTFGDFGILGSFFLVGGINGHIVEEEITASLKSSILGFGFHFRSIAFFNHLLVIIAHNVKRLLGIRVVQTGTLLVSQHNRQTVFGSRFNHSLKSFIGLGKKLCLLLRRDVLLLVSSQIFGTEHITVGDIGLVAQQFQILLEDFNTLFSLLVANIQVGEFVIIRTALIHVFFLLLVFGQFWIFGFQILYRQEIVIDGFTQIALLLGQLSGKVIVHIEVNGVGKLLVLDVRSGLFSGSHCAIIIHRQLNLLELGKEVHTRNEDIVGSQGFQYSCHFNHLV